MSKDNRLSRGITIGCMLFCTVMCGMQCHARSQCREDQGASWDPFNGTVCFGDRNK